MSSNLAEDHENAVRCIFEGENEHDDEDEKIYDIKNDKEELYYKSAIQN